MRSGKTFLLALLATLLPAQRNPETKSPPDTLIFTNGEKLVGKLEQSNGASVTFKSDMVGEVKVHWSKIQEIHSDRVFAAIPKNVTIKRHADTSSIPEGAVAVTGQNLTITTKAGTPQTMPVADTAHLVEGSAFENAINRQPGIFTDWKGSITAGATLVQATQQSRTFTGAISLARIEPFEDWLIRRNRTTFDFSGSYGTISQPGTPEIKTDIYHVGLERDEYLSTVFYVFAQGLLDHNFSQNLSLAQTYGGGAGWSVIKRANQNLDLKAGLTYIHQKFSLAGDNKSLVAALFEEDYKRNLIRGMTFAQQLIIHPALNDQDAFSATGSAVLTLPIYRRINSSIGVSDSYLHDPPPGFKKNSFQFTAGFSYAIR